MNEVQYVALKLSEDDLLCQIAEEASELTQAALKLRRALGGANKTPVSMSEAIKGLEEEFVDVHVSFCAYNEKADMALLPEEVFRMMEESKMRRWARRLGWDG